MKSGTLRPGDTVNRFDLVAVSDERLSVPADPAVTHLQFRRFAGCPICTLHLRTFARRHDELTARGIREVIVFNASREALSEYHADVPFALVADPQRILYRRFGIERASTSLFHPATWPALIKGALSTRTAIPEHPLSAFGLPTDFLVTSDGRVSACKYGRHADDHWSVDETISLSASPSKHQREECRNECAH